MQVTRDSSFDSFRGIAIIAVIATHCIYRVGDPDSPGFLYYRQLLNFCVPVFFFMSGYWASKESIVSLNGYKVFLTKKFFRICVPYLFWSFLSLTSQALKNHNFSVSEAAFKLLTGGAIMGYYFVIALVQLYIMTPFLHYINRRLNWYGVILVLGFNLVAVFALYLSRLFHVIPHLPMALLFYSWIIYYELGLFLGPRFSEIHVSSMVRVAVLFAIPICLLISVFEASVLLHRYGRSVFIAFPTKYSSMLYAIVVILGYISWKEYLTNLPRPLATIGHYSFGIYLIHMIIMGLLLELFQNFGVISRFQPIYQLVLVTATTGLSAAVILAARKILPELFCTKILGF
ncbi:MAG: acyltransferase [Sedimentisphaerales bacterium]|nr:acyltransferase [Sedimentisphaerales bacterium]